MTPYCATVCAIVAVNSSPRTADLFSLATLPDAPENALRILTLLPSIGNADCEESAIDLLREVLHLIGAESGVFVSMIKDDALRTSVRTLAVCDPLWVIEYSRLDWPDADPWLRHALECQTPVRGCELKAIPEDLDFLQRAAGLGFASTIVVPAPSCLGAARTAVLVLGSRNPAFFDGSTYQMVRLVARELAMELHEWLLKSARADLLERSQLTEEEIELLRHEAAGHTSKMIAAALAMKPRTVDGWFQRVSAKLKAPDRRSAMRIARLYGLL